MSVLFPLLTAASSTELSLIVPHSRAAQRIWREHVHRESESSHSLCFQRMLKLKISFYFSKSKIAIFKMRGNLSRAKAPGNSPIPDKKQKNPRLSTKGPVGDPFIWICWFIFTQYSRSAMRWSGPTVCYWCMQRVTDGDVGGRRDGSST